MKCKYAKRMFSEYLDNELKPDKRQFFENHFKSCLKCKKEFEIYRKTLESLKKWKDIEPEPQYMSKFWAEIAEDEQKSRIIPFIKVVLNRKLVYGLAVAGILFIIISGPLHNYLIDRQFKTMLSQLDEETIEMLNNYALIKNYDLVKSIEYLDEM